MKISAWQKAALVFESLVIVMLTVSTGWLLIQYHESRIETQKLRSIATDPHARPDAWTKTDDDRRTMILCTAVRLNASMAAVTRARIEHLLPNICGNVFTL